ncbi:MAG: HAMP domain-containing sensor histidine kinase [Campylobacterota bacterium]|nr:HAMP domain-containing sensor histidine kinase [Campylobacterota bacterium]
MNEREKLLNVKETIESIAHQWRQPLAQINSTVGSIDKILYEKNIQEPLLEEKLQKIEALTKYMSDTIDDFKKHFLQSTNKEKIVLAEIVQSAISNVMANLEENNIKIITEIDVEDECFCYKNQLEQIIMVLLNNSKDALLERNTFEAEIEVAIKKSEGHVVLSIGDNAGGITKSVMQKIFEPYYTTKHNSQGTGIGLYMAKKIIQEQDGLLSVRNIKSGSEFRITLPEVLKL